VLHGHALVAGDDIWKKGWLPLTIVNNLLEQEVTKQ
jgi:hypothetical protein